LWCNLTPSQALKVSSSHHEVYYDIFEQDHQALKNLCNAIKESIKRNPQLLHYQLFTLRYSLEKSTLHQNKASGLFVDDPSENPRDITQEDIVCVAEVLQALSLANPTEDIFSPFVSPVFKKAENIKTPQWLMGVLEHLSQTSPQSVLHDKISEYLSK